MKYGYNPSEYEYFLFDMDGDSNPELGISEVAAADTRKFIYKHKWEMVDKPIEQTDYDYDSFLAKYGFMIHGE